MKNKTKMALMAVGLSCAVVGCLGSATYAWFTTNNEPGVQHTNLTVGSENPNLSVTYARLVPASTETKKTSKVEQIADSLSFSDVSSKYGETFYKKKTAPSTGFVQLGADELEGQVVQFGLTVSNLAMTKEMNLQMRTMIDYSNGDSGKSLRTWTRMGIYECTNRNFDTKKEGGYEGVYVYAKYDPGINQYVDGTTEEDIKTFETDDMDEFGLTVDIKQGIKNVSYTYLKVSIWMEGSVAINQDAARGGIVSIIQTFSLATPAQS